MKKTFLLLFALVTVLSGCVLSEQGKDDGENGSGGAAGAYFPAKLAGASFTWKRTEADASGGSPSVSTYTVSISDGTVLDGRAYLSAYYGSGERYNRFFLDGDGLYFRLDGTMYGLNEGEYPYGRPSESDFCFFSFTTASGVERTVMDWGSTTDSTYVNYRIKEMYLGPSPVTVPAGAFDNCRQYRLKPSLTFTPKITGDIVSSSRTEYHWFAKGIGPVRREISVENNGRSYKTITEELVSYSLP